MNDIAIDQSDEEILAHEISDEALEAAAGTSAEAGASLWSTISVAGCTCVTDTD